MLALIRFSITPPALRPAGHPCRSCRGGCPEVCEGCQDIELWRAGAANREQNSKRGDDVATR